MKNIRIGGAGIAGLTCAINLRIAGFNVEVFERNPVAGAHRHGDFEGLENWTDDENILNFLEKINIKIGFPNNPCNEVLIFDHKDKKYSIKSETPFFYIVKRGKQLDSLDSSLACQAESLGVKIIYNSHIDPKEVDIVATGHSGKPSGIAMGLNFKTNLSNMVAAVVDSKISANCYFYLIVNNGEATLAVALGSHSKFKNIKLFLELAIERFKKLFDFEIRDSSIFSGVASFHDFKPMEKIYVGEAAGFQDALFGFGMRYAFLSGFLASESIIKNSDYWKTTKEKIYPMVKTSIVNHWLWRNLRKIALFALPKILVSKGDFIKIVQRQYRPHWLKNVLFPFARFSYRNHLKRLK